MRLRKCLRMHKRDSKIGLLYCYNSLYQIYEIKDLKSLAIEYCLKGIELTETYHVDNYNISTSYTEVAKYYINQGIFLKLSKC